MGIGDKVRETARRAPEWELLVHMPGVFVRVANNRLTGYGTWKSVRKMGGRRIAPDRPHPLFFVSVASKGLSHAVSLLLATFTGEHISVASKGFTRTVYWRESNWEGWQDFGGVRRTAWRGRMVRMAQKNRANLQAIIAYWYLMSMITCKWFGWRRIAGCLFGLAPV